MRKQEQAYIAGAPALPRKTDAGRQDAEASGKTTQQSGGGRLHNAVWE
jgi:hypothetical protein